MKVGPGEAKKIEEAWPFFLPGLLHSLYGPENQRAVFVLNTHYSYYVTENSLQNVWF
jgi:hypothetical protein